MEEKKTAQEMFYAFVAWCWGLPLPAKIGLALADLAAWIIAVVAIIKWATN